MTIVMTELVHMAPAYPSARTIRQFGQYPFHGYLYFVSAARATGFDGTGYAAFQELRHYIVDARDDVHGLELYERNSFGTRDSARKPLSQSEFEALVTVYGPRLAEIVGVYVESLREYVRVAERHDIPMTPKNSDLLRVAYKLNQE